MKKSKRLTAILLCCMLLVGQMLVITASAARKINLTVDYKYEDLPLSQAQFDIYKIATVNGNGEIKPISPFSYYALDFSKTDNETMHSLALTMASYIARDGIMPYDSAVTDADGKAAFPNNRTGITGGLYLVIGHDTTVNGVKYTTEPFITQLPAKGADGTANYDVTARPKASDTDQAGRGKLKVLKVWDDNGSTNRPDEITVDLIKDGKVADSVVLNNENFWRHTWNNLDKESRYYVAERGAPDGYTVLMSFEGITFIITNTKETPDEPTTVPDETDTPEDTTSSDDTTHSEESTTGDKKPNLPQTGMLRWPVPYLACAGLVLFMAGWVRHRKSEIENEE